MPHCEVRAGIVLAHTGKTPMHIKTSARSSFKRQEQTLFLQAAVMPQKAVFKYGMDLCTGKDFSEPNSTTFVHV